MEGAEGNPDVRRMVNEAKLRAEADEILTRPRNIVLLAGNELVYSPGAVVALDESFILRFDELGEGLYKPWFFSISA